MRMTKNFMHAASLRLRLASIAALALGACAALSVSAQDANGVCHVTKAGVHAADGATWNTAMDLGTALAATACTEVWVATGVYTPGSVVTDTFYINRAVAVYGGFAGTEAGVAERVPGVHPTILSGDIDHNDFSVNGVDVDTDAIVGSNSRHVVTIDGTTAAGKVTASTVLDGFTITGGDARSASFSGGGGLFCVGSGSGHECSPSIAHVTFSGNLAVRGGAMFNDGTDGTSYPQLTNVTFSGNRANYGGAMWNAGVIGISSPSLANVTFSDNEADIDAGAMFNDGFHGVSSPILTNVTFSGNSAIRYGGAIINATGSYGLSESVLSNVILWGNTDDVGAEVYLVGADAKATINFSIVAGGTWGVVYADGSGSSAFYSGIGNLATDPDLGDLADNGGFTQTLLPGVGSAAIDLGTCGGAPDFDQRGLRRAQGPRCDIGAVEVEVVRPGGRCHVDHDAVGANDGSSWTDAYFDLATAMQDATCIEIWVANGVYLPGTETTDTFTVRPGTKVYGGFASGETSLFQRNPAANLTVLSGDIDNNDSGANGVDATVANIQGSNANHVLTLDGTSGAPITASTLLDGFTITGGDARSASFSGGGAVLCDGAGIGHECSPTLSQLAFVGNAAQSGGALYNWAVEGGASSPALTQVSFSGNSATESGGAMYNDGAIGISNPSLTHVSFSANTAAQDGGAMYNAGYLGVSSPTLTNVTFTANTAGPGYDGGAMYNDGESGVSSPSLTNVTFSGNSAYSGGAMYNQGTSTGESSPTLVKVTFDGNGASESGGAMYNDGSNGGVSSPTLTNVSFSANIAYGAGLLISSGGAMFNNGDAGTSSPSLTNVSFSGNSAEFGDAMRNLGYNGGTSNPTLLNVILWDDVPASAGVEISSYTGGNGSAVPSIDYGVVLGGDAGIIDDSGTASTAFSSGTGNLAGDPLLGILAGNGGTTQTLLPSNGSSAIDHGTCTGAPLTDQRGIARPQGVTCDIGAVEVGDDVIFANGFD